MPIVTTLTDNYITRYYTRLHSWHSAANCVFMQVVEYDEESYDNFDFTYKDGNDEEGLMSELDAAASSLDGCRYYNNSKEGPQLAVRDIKARKEKSQKKGTTAGPSNSRGGGDGDDDGNGDDDGMLVVFDTVEAANAKAAEVVQQEAKTVPEECELLLDEPMAAAGAAAAGASAAASTAGKKGSKGRAGAAGSTGEKGGKAGRGKLGPESSAAAAAAAGDVGAMVDMGGGRGSWQVEQVMKVAMWDEVNCIAVSTIFVEVVPVQLKRGG
jgi:hypothetical protein